jgi:hypothetical protein
MGMPEVDEGSDSDEAFSQLPWDVRPDSPRIESRWRSDKVVVTKGKVGGGRGRLGMEVMYERSGDGCLIARHPGP